MPQIDYSIKMAGLEQGNSFQPRLTVQLELKFVKYGNNDPDYIEIMGVRGKLLARTNNSNWFEVCFVEQDGHNSVRLNDTTVVRLVGQLSPYLVLKLENLRSGNDLWFKIQNPNGWCVARGNNQAYFETLSMQQRGTEECKYPKSEWIEHLNATEFNKIELIELPKIEFPKLPLTEHILKFLTNATRAYNEGRYGDVLKECRNALDALDSGVEEWVKSKPSVKMENNTKETTKGALSLSVLLNDKEKATRLYKIINDLHYYLSLNPHEAEYHGMVFTNYDAKFVLHAVTSLVSDILKHIENN